MKPLANPLEAVFGMEEGTTDPTVQYDMIETQGNLPAASAEAPIDHKDEDDLDIERKLNEVYDIALNTFQQQTAYTEIIEPRYAARNAEVAANYLNIALTAVNSKAKVKTDRKRANQAFIPFAQQNKTTNNLIVADRNSILKMLDMDGDKKVIE